MLMTPKHPRHGSKKIRWTERSGMLVALNIHIGNAYVRPSQEGLFLWNLDVKYPATTVHIYGRSISQNSAISSVAKAIRLAEKWSASKRSLLR